MIFEKFKSNLKNSILDYLNNNGDEEQPLTIANDPERSNYENDFKIITDTILREVMILDLASQDEIDFRKLEQILNLSISFAKNDLCSLNTPIVLLSEILDCRTLKECEKLFSLIDDNIHIWKEEFFFKNVKNYLLRTCNDLLRRLSRNQNTVFCGRILIFLANFFPLFERSGLNLTSEFNQDNSTSYLLQGGEGDENLASDLKPETDEDNNVNKADINVDINFYRKFWHLQEYFRNPTITYQKHNFKNFQNYCNEVLSVFAGYKIDPNSCFYFQALGLDHKDDKTIFFVKYLTNQKLLELQLSDSNFRRHILIQILIIFQYFTSNVKFRILENATLSEDQIAWIDQTKEKVYQLIEETPPNGQEVRKVIEHLLQREEFWNNWKNEGCSELKVTIEPEETSKRTADFIRSTYAGSNKKARLGNHVKNAIAMGKILIGNAEMNRLWNFCPDNLEACKSDKRIFTPTIEQFFEPILKLPPEEKKYHCSDPNFCWKALRLLSQKSNYFFPPSSQMVKTVSDYLEGVIERLAQDLNITGAKSATNNNEDNKTETEDISDDELLKNVDSNSVKSNEEDTMDALDNSNLNNNNNNELNSTTTTTNDQTTLLSEDILNEQKIEQIALKIKDYWNELSPAFGFTDDELDYIKDSFQDPLARMKHLITIWKDEQGPEKGNLKHLLQIIQSIKPETIL